MKTTEYTCAWPNLARTCEVALVGNFTVNIVHDTIKYPEMPNDFELIKGYFSGVTFCKSGDLSTTIHRPDINVSYNGERWIEVTGRAERVNIEQLPITRTSEEFLRIILRRFSASVTKGHLILKVANIIACMDNCKEIEPNHIAESFQYAGLSMNVGECSVFSSLEKERTKDFIDLLTDEQVEKVNNYLHKLYKK